MKTTIAILTITILAIGLFIKTGWLALVILPVVLIFAAATFAPLMTGEFNEQNDLMHTPQTAVAFGD